MPTSYPYPIYVLLAMLLNLPWFIVNRSLRCISIAAASLVSLTIINEGWAPTVSFLVLLSNIFILFLPGQPKLGSFKKASFPLLIGLALLTLIPLQPNLMLILILVYSFWYPLQDENIYSWTLSGELLASIAYLVLIHKGHVLAGISLLCIWKVGQIYLSRFYLRSEDQSGSFPLLRG